MPPVPLPIESFTDTAVDNINTRCVNIRAIKSPENSISPFYLEVAQGLVNYISAGTGPIRANAEFEGNLYIASGFKIFKITPAKVVTEWGVISNGDNMPMVVGFDFILAVGGNGELYLIDDDGVETIAAPFLVQDVAYFQGVFVFIRKDAPTAGEYFTSKVSPDAGDKISFKVSDFANAETEADAAVGVIRKGDLLWIMGVKTVEVFSFGDGIPFPDVPGLFFDVGCASRNSISKSRENIYWLGSDLTIRENGKKISTKAVIKAIKAASFIDGSFSFTFEEDGSEFVSFTFGLESTWVFDIDNRIWHERQTYLRDEWQARTAIRFDDKQLIGDGLAGQMFELSDTVHDYDGSPRIWIVQMPYIHAEGARLGFGPLQIKINGGAGTSQILDPQLIIEYSKDGGRNWSNEIFKSMGARGDYRDPIKLHRLGKAEDMLIRISASDAVLAQLIWVWMGANFGSRT